MLRVNSPRYNTRTLAYSQAGITSRVLGALPLALDQAGAYIEETKCSLADYINLYQTRREMLLKWRGGLSPDQSRPLATPSAISLPKPLPGPAVVLVRLDIFLFPAPRANSHEPIFPRPSLLRPLL